MNTKMKLITLLLLMVVVTVGAVVERPSESGPSFDIDSIASYRDIPGVTDEEINAIEALRAARQSFSYGSLLSAEAFVLPDGTYAGFTPAFCELLSDLFEIPFVPELYSWDSLKSGIDGGIIDFTGGLASTAEQRRFYYMTYPIAQRSLAAFTHGDSVKLESEADLNGLSIGFLENTVIAGSVLDAYPALEFEAVNVQNIADAVEKLKSGAIDALITNAVESIAFRDHPSIRSYEVIPMAYTPVSLTTANPELEPIISVVGKFIAVSDIDKLDGLYRESGLEYAKYELSRLFTEEEAAYIAGLAADGSKAPVALERSFYPVCFYDKNDKVFQGIAPDILAEISLLTGIEFHVATGENTFFYEILEMLDAGEVAFVSSLLLTPERRDRYLWSERYHTSNYALLSKIDFPYVGRHQVARLRVGVSRATAYEEMYYAWFRDKSNLAYYDSTIEAVNALDRGEIDLVMASENALLALTHYYEKPEYKTNIRFNALEESYFGFNINEEILSSIIRKAQRYVDTDRISVYWTNRVFDHSKKLAEERFFYLAVSAAILLLLLIILSILSVKNAKIRKTIVGQTAILSAIYDSLPAMVFSKDLNGIYTSCNSRFAKLARSGKSDIIGRTFSEVILYDKKLLQDVIEADKKVINESITVTAEGWYLLPDKSRNPMEVTRTPLVQDGRVVGLLGIAIDIAERKKAEEAARKAHESAKLMLDTMPLCCCLINKDYEVIDCNNETLRLFEMNDKREFIDRFHEFAPKYQPNGRRSSRAIIVHMKKAVKEGRRVFEWAMQLSDGTPIPATIMFVRVNYSDGYAVLAYAQDKRMEESNRAKSKFLAMMSHEIRTPMNAILGITEIQLQNEALEPGVMEALGKIYNSGEMLLGIINDILDMSKIEAGKLELTPGEYNIASLINDVTTLNMMRIGGKPIEFELLIDQNTPSVLFGDELRIKQILNNLLSNSFKYTKKGVVELSVSAETKDEGKKSDVTLVFRVSDTGQGMTEEQVSKLFDEYSRFNMEANRATEGTGLGMNITQNLVRLMDGEIFVESDLGKGTVVTVRLPQRRIGGSVLGGEMAENLRKFRADAVKQIRRTQVSLEPMPYGRVLVVDDADLNLYVARGLLAPYQLSIDTAESGFEAIGKIESGQEYDIVFMDHMMPEMDGVETVKIIRGMGYSRPIVALTADAVSGRADMFLENGFDAFISKPVDMRNMDAILKKLIRDRQPREIVEASRRKDVKITRETDAETEAGFWAAVGEIGAINAEIGMSRFSGMRNVYHDTLELFHKKLPRECAAMTDFMSAEDTVGFSIAVHSMKSQLSTIGAMSLAETAQKLETASKDGIMDYCVTHFPAFKENLLTLRARLSAVFPDENASKAPKKPGDQAYMREQIEKALKAAGDFDEDTAIEALNLLQAYDYGEETGALLEGALTALGDFDFDTAADVLGRIERRDA